MNPGEATLAAWASLPFALAAFALPGWLIARHLAAPLRAPVAFFISAAAWFQLVLLCNTLGVPLARGPLLGGWGVLCLTVCLWTRRTSSPVSTDASLRPSGREWGWLAAAALAFVSIGVRGIVDPLNGWDNPFRWDYLARTIWMQGNFDFYPAVTSAQFEIYSWCDGIPPLVSLLNFWIYLFTGADAPALITGRVLAEAALIGVTVFSLSRSLWGREGGWPAVAILATSALLLWGVGIGQETGLTTLSLAGLAYLLIEYKQHPSRRTAAWAGLAAGVGALSREYGLAFVLFGLVALVLERKRRTDALLFVAVSAGIAAPWYVRNWIVTGNPVYPNLIGNLFPTNPAYADNMTQVAAYWRFGSVHLNPVTIALTVGILAAGVILAASVGVCRAGRRAWPLLAAAALITALWAWSVHLTAGGWNYSLRVLCPAVALGAALGGWIGGLRRMQWVVMSLVILLAGDAARRSWLLPVNPKAPPLPYSWQDWRACKDYLNHISQHPLWNALAARARDKIVLVDSPSAHAFVTARGGRAALFFSPAAQPCFDDNLPFEEAVRQLKRNNVALLLLTVNDPISQGLIQKHPFLRVLCARHTPLLRLEAIALYDLNRLDSGRPAAP